jgi:hypothetical protein
LPAALPVPSQVILAVRGTNPLERTVRNIQDTIGVGPHAGQRIVRCCIAVRSTGTLLDCPLPCSLVFCHSGSPDVGLKYNPLQWRALFGSCPELAVLANPDPAFEKCDFQKPFISTAYAVEMLAHPCAGLVPIRKKRFLDRD